jgi:hypothetical protein
MIRNLLERFWIVCFLGIVLFLSQDQAAGRGPYCTPNSKDADLMCYCLQYHPDQEFCNDENAPLPSCCKAAEKGAKAKACACCSSKKRAIDPEVRGTYIHNR